MGGRSSVLPFEPRLALVLLSSRESCPQQESFPPALASHFSLTDGIGVYNKNIPAITAYELLQRTPRGKQLIQPLINQQLVDEAERRVNEQRQADTKNEPEDPTTKTEDPNPGARPSSRSGLQQEISNPVAGALLGAAGGLINCLLQPDSSIDKCGEAVGLGAGLGAFLSSVPLPTPGLARTAVGGSLGAVVPFFLCLGQKKTPGDCMRDAVAGGFISALCTALSTATANAVILGACGPILAFGLEGASAVAAINHAEDAKETQRSAAERNWLFNPAYRSRLAKLDQLVAQVEKAAAQAGQKCQDLDRLADQAKRLGQPDGSPACGPAAVRAARAKADAAFDLLTKARLLAAEASRLSEQAQGGDLRDQVEKFKFAHDDGGEALAIAMHYAAKWYNRLDDAKKACPAARIDAAVKQADLAAAAALNAQQQVKDPCPQTAQHWTPDAPFYDPPGGVIDPKTGKRMYTGYGICAVKPGETSCTPPGIQQKTAQAEAPERTDPFSPPEESNQSPDLDTPDRPSPSRDAQDQNYSAPAPSPTPTVAPASSPVVPSNRAPVASADPQPRVASRQDLLPDPGTPRTRAQPPAPSPGVQDGRRPQEQATNPPPAPTPSPQIRPSPPPVVKRAEPTQPPAPSVNDDMSKRPAELAKRSPSPAPSPAPQPDVSRSPSPPAPAENRNRSVLPPAPANAPPSRPDDAQHSVAALTNQPVPGQLRAVQPVDPHRARDEIIRDPPGSGQGSAPQAATQNAVRNNALAQANKAVAAPRPGAPQGPRPTPSLLQMQRAKENALAAAKGSPASAQRAQQRPAQQSDVRGRALAHANKAVTARRPGAPQDSRPTSSLLQLQQAKNRAVAAAKPPPASRHVPQPSRNTARAPVYKVPQVRSSRQAYSVQPRHQPSFRPRVAEHRAPAYRAPPRAQGRYAQPRSQPRYAQPRPQVRYAQPRPQVRYAQPRPQMRYAAPRPAPRPFAPRVAAYHPARRR
jgi:hypothetical protein